MKCVDYGSLCDTFAQRNQSFITKLGALRCLRSILWLVTVMAICFNQVSVCVYHVEIQLTIIILLLFISNTEKKKILETSKECPIVLGSESTTIEINPDQVVGTSTFNFDYKYICIRLHFY